MRVKSKRDVKLKMLLELSSTTSYTSTNKWDRILNRESRTQG